MANLDLLVLVNGVPTRKPSSSNSVSFLSVLVGTDSLEIKDTSGAFDFSGAAITNILSVKIGADALAISQTGSGAGAAFSFGARKLSNIADGAVATDAASYGQVLLANGVNAATADLNLNSHKITNLSDPTNPQDAVTKAYADAIAAGLKWKEPVRAIATSNIALSGTQTVDGVALIAGDRVLVAGQTAASQNAIYVAAAGAWARSIDASASSQILELAVFVQEGISNADTGWVLTTNAPITLGTTNLSFVQFTGLGTIIAGAGLTKTGNQLDVGANADSSITVNADDIQLHRDVAGALGVSGAGVKVNVDSSTTQITSNNVAVKLDAAGAIASSGSGLAVQLESSNPSLQISANKLGAKLDPTGAIITGVSGLKVQVDNSTLDINGSDQVEIKAAGVTEVQLASSALLSTGGLQGGSGTKLSIKIADASLFQNASGHKVQEDPAGAIVTSASGIAVNPDGTSLDIVSNQLEIKAQGVSAAKLGAVTGAGLTGGAGAVIAVGQGAGVRVNSNSVQVEYSQSLTNDNAGAITVRQVVYQKTNGHVDLALATNAALSTSKIAVVESASIATTVAGLVYVVPGAVIGGFSGMTPGAKQYISRATVGALVEWSAASFQTGDVVVVVGEAISATQLVYDPKLIAVY